MTKLLLNKGSLGCTLVLLLLFVSCGDNIREEITERYDDGKKKTLLKVVGEGSKEITVKKISYSQSGDTLLLENYNSKGEKDGNWIGYKNDLYFKNNYKNGELDGKATRYYENGQIKEERTYKDGKREGKWTRYHKNGQIAFEGNYKDSELDGKATRYHKNGQIAFEGNYKDGIPDGKWTDYNKDGTIDRVENWENGKRID